MDFRVVPRRSFKKTTVSLFSLLLLILWIPALLGLLSGLYLSILMDLGLYPHGPEARQAAGPESVIVMFGVVPLLYLWRLRRHQRRLQQALQNLNLMELTKDGKVGLFLYLRSFRLGRSTLLRRLVPFAYGDQSLLGSTFGTEVFHFEEDISNAIYPHGLLIAIGDRHDSYGAGKVIVSDEKWKDRFHELATHSCIIFMQPDLTQSVRWEIGQLLSNTLYLRKTVWFMPRSGGDKWNEIRDGLRQDIGIVLPPHHAEGGMFHLRPDSDEVPVVVPKMFVSTLTTAIEKAEHKGHPFDVEPLLLEAYWDSRANEEQIRANDQEIREIGKRRLKLR